MTFSKRIKECDTDRIKGIDTDRAWMKVHKRLENEDLLPGPQMVQHLNLKRLIAYAATVLLIIAFGSLSYMLFFNSPSSPLLTIQTAADKSTYIQTFGDGSVVYMADNSVLDYPEIFNKSQRKVYLSGEAFFEVSSKADQPFVIATDYALVEVIGTSFNIRSNDDVFEVIVEEGQVSVMPNNIPGHSEIIGEWEMLTIVESKMEKAPVIDRTYLSWRTNRMQFKNEKIADIASVISKNFNVGIYFEDESIHERRLTVTFHNNELKTIAEVIAAAYGIDYEILDDSKIVFGNIKSD